jgi:putative ABC transport system permease protein
MSIGFLWLYPLRALRRGGQRTFLALLCVAFGVMSLTAMQLLTANFANAIMNDPRAEVGGDVRIASGNMPFTPDQLNTFAQLKRHGVIQAYTPLVYGGAQFLKVDGRNEIYVLDNTLGIDARTYPLVGQVTLRTPVGATLAEVLQADMSAVVTRDLADKANLHIGDHLTISSRDGSAPHKLVLSGIIQSMPDRRGDMVMVTLRTAQVMAGWGDVASRVAVVWQDGIDPDVIASQLQQWESNGWNVLTPRVIENDSNRLEVVDTFGYMFKGAGLLGLMVGGIGVATTMRVLLARRTLEIAMLKTLGYRQFHLTLLFAVEALWIGLMGSATGLLAALVVSQQLTGLLSRTGAMLVDETSNPLVLVSGLLAGMLTTLVFGLQPITASGTVRPAVILRQDATNGMGGRTARNAGVWALYALLAVLFTLICAFIMGTLAAGVAVVVLALVGLTVLGFLLGALLLLIARAPLPGARRVTLARVNLNRQKARLIFPLIALFAGVFAIGFAAVTLLSASERVNGHRLPAEGENLLIYAQSTDEAALRSQLAQQQVISVTVRNRVSLVTRQRDGTVLEGIDAVMGLSADDLRANLIISAAPTVQGEDRLYLPALPAPYELSVRIGAPLTVTLADGRQRAVRVAGFYQSAKPSLLSLREDEAVMAFEQVNKMAPGSAALGVMGRAPAQRLVAVTDALRETFPRSIVLNLIDLDSFVNRAIMNLWAFVVAVAGLALVAGGVLIANAVGLAMLERRREVGIFKAVGYSSADILRTIGAEHGLLGLLSGATGMAGVAIAVNIINMSQPAAKLTLDLWLVVAMLVVSIVIAAGVATLVAWRPAHVRPLDVLRAE